MITTKQVAQAAGIAPATKRYVVRDEFGLAYDGCRTEHVLSALARSDKTVLPADVHTVAYAICKCLSTARMNVTLARRVRAYSPYQVCALVAKVTNAAGDTQIGDYFYTTYKLRAADGSVYDQFTVKIDGRA